PPMKNGKTGRQRAGELRLRAEKIARAMASRMAENLDDLSPEAVRKLLHEVRVHQVQLEMQNEELRRAQEELEVSRARYFDLYELAPVGYVTLSEKGLILEANLTFAALLRLTRGELINQPLTRFIVRGDQDIHYRHCKRLLETGASQVYEVRMSRKEADPFWTRVEAAAVQDAGGDSVWRVAISDITRRILAEQAEKRATEELQRSHDALEERVEERTAEVRILSARLLSAQEEERRRIARDLHDGLGGLLSAIKYKFEAAQGPEDLKEVVALLQEAIADCRRVQKSLRPSLLEDLGLLATLNWLTREFEKKTQGVRLEKQFEIEESAIPQTLKTVIFRITQEALNNISRHSRADRVWLSLRNFKGALELAVRDNGQGFESEKALSTEGTESGGFGLAIMRERAEGSGGTCSIVSGPGAGTIVRASWPKKTKEAESASGKKGPGSGKRRSGRAGQGTGRKGTNKRQD
ncbi:MAG TPA: ATP-binding protein, partial [Thermodesulfobacteriota bacterium]|nr:ATP-binding protein [Thermodesulfobacteriota bacterium]